MTTGLKANSDGSAAIQVGGSDAITITSGLNTTFVGTVAVAGSTTALYPLVSGTAVTASGTSVDFTGIPSTAKRITVMFAGVSTNGTSVVQIQLGTGATPTYTTTGYAGAVQTNSTLANSTTGFATSVTRSAVQTQSGLATISNLNSNIWSCSGNFGDSQAANNSYLGSSISLAAALTAVRITTVNGTDTFDAGTINIMWE